MSDEELKKIVEEEVGNNDPFWNQPVFNIVKQIRDLSDGTESTISKFVRPEQSANEKFMSEISKTVIKACERINILLDYSKHQGQNMEQLYNIPFVKGTLGNGDNKEKEVLNQETRGPKITDEELKKIVEEEVGNNDPYWNQPVFNVVKLLMSLPDGTETTIGRLVSPEQMANTKFMFGIGKPIKNVCERINIYFDYSKRQGQYIGQPYNIPFVKRTILNADNKEKVASLENETDDSIREKTAEALKNALNNYNNNKATNYVSFPKIEISRINYNGDYDTGSIFDEKYIFEMKKNICYSESVKTFCNNSKLGANVNSNVYVSIPFVLNENDVNKINDIISTIKNKNNIADDNVYNMRDCTIVKIDGTSYKLSNNDDASLIDEIRTVLKIKRIDGVLYNSIKDIISMSDE